MDGRGQCRSQSRRHTDTGVKRKLLIIILLLILIPRSSLAVSQSQFDHEKLQVYQKAIAFVGFTEELLDTLPKSLAIHGQLDRASTSIPLNIAEGNGKYTPADRCRFFDIARGSALESAACLDVLVSRKRIDESVAHEGKELLISIVSMLVGLIRANSDTRDV